MRTTSTRRAGVFAALLASGALIVAGCGGERAADVENGKKLFTSGTCAGCHELADAQKPGVKPPTTGPNLDDAFRGARQQDFESSSFEGVVLKWIEQPEQISEPIMPAKLLTGDDARDVAAYIAKVAGTSKESPARPAEEIE